MFNLILLLLLLYVVVVVVVSGAFRFCITHWQVYCDIHHGWLSTLMNSTVNMLQNVSWTHKHYIYTW